MSFILAQWLNNELNLSNHVQPTELDSALKSGYELGEILYKLELQDDFPDIFIKASNSEACIKNYSIVEKTLRDKLNIRLTSNQAFDIIQGKSGCAAKLLYQIKSAYSRLPSIDSSDRKLVNKKKNDKKLTSYPATPQGNSDIFNISAPTELSQEYEESKISRYIEKEHAFFKELLKSKLYKLNRFNQNNLRTEVLDTKKSMTDELNKTLPKVYPKMTITKTKNIDPKTNEDRILEQKKRDDSVKRLEEINHIRNYEKTQKKISNENAKQQQITRNFLNDVFEFESKLNPIQLSNQTNTLEFSTPKNDEEIDSENGLEVPIDPELMTNYIQSARKDAITHIKTISKNLPPAKVTLNETDTFIKKIKDRNIEEEASKKNRELRRRKLLLQQQCVQEDLEKNQLEDLILNQLTRQSKQERRIAEQLMQIRREKQIIVENRMFRQMQYEKQRKNDYEISLQREFELSERLRNQYNEQVETQMSQHKAILSKKAEIKHQKVTKNVSELVSEIIELSLKVSEYRSLLDNEEIPAKLLRQWKVLFFEKQPLSNKYEIALEKEKIAPPNEILVIEPEVAPGINAMDDSEYINYLTGKNEWLYWESNCAVEKSLASLKNEPLAQIIDDVLQLSTPIISKYKSLDLPLSEMKIAIIGKPFSGKTSIAKEIASKFNLEILEVETLIKTAIKDADALNDKPKRNAAVPIGSKIQSALLQGKSPDDSLIITLISSAISSLAAKSKKGWILVNFPRTLNQAMLLERELTGYVEPTVVIPGNLVRDVSGSLPKQRSMIHLKSASDNISQDQKKSGLDSMILLDINNNLSFKRALGERVDPMNDLSYNLDSNTPPTDQPGLQERLSEVESYSESKKQLQHQISNFEAHEGELKELYSKFQNLHVLDASKTSEWTSGAVEVMLEAIADSKIISSKSLESQEKNLQSAESERPISGDVVIPASRVGTPGQNSNSAGSTPAAGSAPLMEIALKGSTESVAPVVTPPAVIDNILGKSKGSPSKIKPPASAQVKDSKLQVNLLTHMVRHGQLEGRKVPTKELALILANNWELIESKYANKLKFLFRMLRNEKDESIRFFNSIRTHIKSYLERPDKKQDYIDLFQREYNALEEDFRSDVDVKAELHHRSDDLREKLWELSDIRKEEADAERLSIIEDRWVEDHAIILQNIFISFFQAEVDRFTATKQFVIDYFKDAYGSIITDNVIPHVNLPTPAPTQAPPIEISGILINYHHESQGIKKEAEKSGGPNSKAKTGSAAATAGGKKAAVTAAAPVSSQKAIIDISVKHIVNEKQYPVIDFETIQFPDIQAAYDAAFSAATDHHVTDSIPDDKDKVKKGKKPTTAEIENGEAGMPAEYLQIFEHEERLFKDNILRIQKKAKETITALVSEGMSNFISLDSWIGSRYCGEMEAIREVLLVIREAIEIEARLPNHLELIGDRFKVNYSVLTVPLEPEPRPESPVEKQNFYQFSCLQIMNFARQFREVAPTGMISNRDFSDFMIRMGSLSVGTNIAPGMFSAIDSQCMHQICAILDTFETGFVSWRKYLYIQSRILPVPSLEYLVNLKAIIKSLPSFKNGTISHDDFLSIPFWFSDDNYTKDGSNRFNRSEKIKNSIFYIFSCSSETVPLDDVNIISKCGSAASKNGSVLEAEENASPKLHENSAENVSTTVSVAISISVPEENESLAKENNESQKLSQNLEETKIENETATFKNLGASIITEHDILDFSNDLFDVNAFLLCSCMDPIAMDGLRKAFYIQSQESNGICSLEDAYKIFHFMMPILPDSHRLSDSEISTDPYPLDLLKLLINEETNMINFDVELEKSSPEFAILQVCSLYLLEDVTIVKSRPNSQQQPVLESSANGL